MGSTFSKNFLFSNGCEHSREIQMLKISHASVNEPEAAARGLRAKITTLEQQNAEASPGGVFRNRESRDTSANDQEVVETLLNSLQISLEGRHLIDRFW